MKRKRVATLEPGVYRREAEFADPDDLQAFRVVRTRAGQLVIFALQTPQLRGWLDKAIVPLFRAYAELCFHEYGSKVKYWVTFNEAWTFVVLGYGTGSKAPGRPYTNISTYP